MKNLLLIGVTMALVAVGLAGTAIGGPPTVKITGGGIATNNNSGLPFGDLLSVGGFSAIKKGDKVKGQIQSKSVLAADPTVKLASIHGKVVCVEEVGGGVWEVRFLVTKATGFAVPLLDGYGSLFVSDGGSPGAGNDMIDEGFADPGSADCGGTDAASHSLEPVIAGNFTVHQ
jgi:hypothetical protein